PWQRSHFQRGPPSATPCSRSPRSAVTSRTTETLAGSSSAAAFMTSSSSNSAGEPARRREAINHESRGLGLAQHARDADVELAGDVAQERREVLLRQLEARAHRRVDVVDDGL